jgi:2-polyprenyl-3-methyl-5-hydroxy-6-metoxy-1,4-benzoquinol methylase
MAQLSVPYRRLADTLLPHLAQFLELPEAEVERRMRGAREERNRRWIASAPRNEAERNRLYAELGELDLLKYAEWHRTDEEKQGLHDELVRFAAKRELSVLDCGGGIGDTTLAFAANGVSVTYIDFPGGCSRFARARQKLFGCEARVRHLAPEEFWADAAGSFDMVVSLDVLEHLENPVQHAVRYRDLLPSGGHLFVTTFFEHSARNPDHLPANDAYRRLFGGERKTSRRCVLTNLGFKEKRWYWFVKP